MTGVVKIQNPFFFKFRKRLEKILCKNQFLYTVLPTTERAFNLILKFQDMFVAEVVQQIVLPSCSYDFSSTTFTIIA